MKDNPVEGLKSIYQQLLERDKKTEERHKRYKKCKCYLRPIFCSTICFVLVREQFDYVNNVHGYLRQQSENLSHQIAQKNLILATLITAEQQEIFDDQILTQNFNKIVQQKKQKQKELVSQLCQIEFKCSLKCIVINHSIFYESIFFLFLYFNDKE